MTMVTKKEAIDIALAELSANKRAAFVLVGLLDRLEQIPECAGLVAQARAMWASDPDAGVSGSRPGAVLEFIFAG